MTTHTTSPVDTSEPICRDHHAIGLAVRTVGPRRRHLHAISSRGIASSVAIEHAVPGVDGSGDTEASVLLYAKAVCGAGDLLFAYGWGKFSRTNPHLDSDACPECAWHVAFTSGQPADELDHITPTEPDQRALALHLSDPLAARHLAEAILATDARQPVQPESRLVGQLAAVTDHAPVVMRPQDCFDGDCEHRGDNDAPGETCPLAEAVVTCPRCGVRPRHHAEDEDPVMASDVVTGACSVFADLMARYAPTLPEGVRR